MTRSERRVARRRRLEAGAVFRVRIFDPFALAWDQKRAAYDAEEEAVEAARGLAATSGWRAQAVEVANRGRDLRVVFDSKEGS